MHGTTPVERKAGTVCYHPTCGNRLKVTSLCGIGMGACRDKLLEPIKQAEQTDTKSISKAALKAVIKEGEQ